MTDKTPSLKLLCLGAPAVLVDDRRPAPDILWRKNLALLAYLALSPGMSRTRDHLLGLLWPEKSEDRARHSLNEAIRRLRAGLGSGRIVSSGDSVALSSEDLEVDVLSGIGANAQADSLGEFLEGLYLEDAPEFERWASNQRRKFRDHAKEFFLREGESSLLESPQVARDTALQVLSSSPHSEPAIDLYMRASALMGDSTGALETFKNFADQLQKDLQENPSRRLDALAERIRSGWWKRAPAASGETDPDLVGRKEIHATAFATVSDALSGHHRCLVVTAEPGMGRSRILAECARRAALSGAVTATARPLGSDADAPWSTISALVRNGLSNAPGLTGADPSSLAVLASVAPALADRFKPESPRDAAHVAASLAAAVKSITEEVPLVMIVDDAHFSDGASLRALGLMMSEVLESPVALIISSLVTSQDVPRELLKLHAEVGRGIPGTAIRLEPLDIEEISELVGSWSNIEAMGDDRERLVRRVAYESGGSPFLTVELLRGFEKTASLREDAMGVWPQPNATLESPLPFSIPTLVRLAISAQVVDLDESSRRVLCAASVGGTALDLDLIALLVNAQIEEVENAVDTLERHDFVQFDGTRYAFKAPMISDVVARVCMTRGEKQRLMRGAVEALANHTDLESRVLRAELLSAINPGDQAFENAIEIAEAALAADSVRAAKRALAAAERCVAKGVPGGERISSLRGRFPK
ncbi:MAG: AAA family ATPase [Gemmatimonadetes bacterium]|nr:AAA family ATPase [Gemmatimonadota bacterium]